MSGTWSCSSQITMRGRFIQRRLGDFLFTMVSRDSIVARANCVLIVAVTFPSFHGLQRLPSCPA